MRAEEMQEDRARKKSFVSASRRPCDGMTCCPMPHRLLQGRLNGRRHGG